MAELVRFAPAHLAAVPWDPAQYGGLDRATAAALFAGHPAWTLTAGGRVLGCGGFVAMPAAGLWQAWIALTPAGRARPRAVLRGVLRGIGRCDLRPARRIVAYVNLAAGPRALALAAWLGLRPGRTLSRPDGARFREFLLEDIDVS